MLEEAASIMMPRQIRKFFVYYLIGDEPFDALQLWNKFQEHMTERDSTTYSTLCDIEEQLNIKKRTCKDFGLPEPAFFKVPVHNVAVEYHLKVCKKMEEKLNADQLAVFE